MSSGEGNIIRGVGTLDEGDCFGWTQDGGELRTAVGLRGPYDSRTTRIILKYNVNPIRIYWCKTVKITRDDCVRDDDSSHLSWRLVD